MTKYIMIWDSSEGDDMGVVLLSNDLDIAIAKANYCIENDIERADEVPDGGYYIDKNKIPSDMGFRGLVQFTHYHIDYMVIDSDNIDEGGFPLDKYLLERKFNMDTTIEAKRNELEETEE